MAAPAARRAAKTVHLRRSLTLKQDLKLVAVADTHSRPHPASAQRIRAQKPDFILHAGDVGDLSVLDELERIAPVVAVRGNIDDRSRLPDSVSIDLVQDGVSRFRLLLVHIAVYGPKLRADVARLAAREKAPLVVCGHSHVPFIGRDKGVTMFNPGSIGPRRFQLPIVFGVIDVGEQVRMRHVSCETGETWEP